MTASSSTCNAQVEDDAMTVIKTFLQNQRFRHLIISYKGQEESQAARVQDPAAQRWAVL